MAFYMETEAYDVARVSACVQILLERVLKSTAKTLPFCATSKNKTVNFASKPQENTTVLRAKRDRKKNKCY